MPTMQSESYFQKNKKMIIALIVLLLIFCGLIGFILMSKGSGTNKAVNGTQDPNAVDDSTPPTSSPITTETIADTFQENTFDIPAGAGDATFRLNIQVPTGSTETKTPRNGINPPMYSVENSDYSLSFYIPSEAFQNHFVDKIDLGLLNNIGTNVYRIRFENMDEDMMVYTNDMQAISGDSCSQPDLIIESPCGYGITKINSGSFLIACQEKLTGGFNICDQIIKSLELEVI